MKELFLSNGGWLLRVVTAAALLVVVALSLFPRFVSHISTSATINAPILIIRSPVEGLVEEYSLENGEVVRRGQDVVVFREAGTDLTQRADLEARLRIAKSAQRAVRSRIAQVEAIQRNLVRRQKIYRLWHTAILEREVEELQAQVRGATARLNAMERGAERIAEMRNRRIVSENEQRETSTQLIEQTEKVRELVARLAVRRLKLNAMRDGVLAGTDGTNTPYTLQRQDEVGLELARLNDELIDHEAEAAAVEEQLEKELEIYQSENRVALTSPVAGVVWRSASLSGRPVLPGDEIVEILDCGARFLEAFLPEGLMGTISVGDLADVQLTGETRSFAAPIISILGNGARFDHVELAAQDNTPKSGKMRVLIQLSATDLSFDNGKFCHVGRTAQVSLPRDLPSVLSVFSRFTNSMKAAVAWVGNGADSNQRG